MKRKLKLHDFDLAEMLESEEDILIYFDSVVEENDPSELAHAIEVIGRSKWMKNKKRENHTKHLKQNASSFLNMYKDLEALGLNLKVLSLDDNNSDKKVA